MFTACAITRAMAQALVEKPSDVSGPLSKVFLPESPAPLFANKIVDAQKNDTTLENFRSGHFGEEKAYNHVLQQ